MMKTYHNENTMKTIDLEINPNADMSDFCNETVTMDVIEILDQIISDIKTMKQEDNDNSELSVNRDSVWRMLRMWSANKTKHYERDTLRNSFDVSNYSAISNASTYDQTIEKLTVMRNRQAKYPSLYSTEEIRQINVSLSR
jgi:hypothetical protein